MTGARKHPRLEQLKSLLNFGDDGFWMQYSNGYRQAEADMRIKINPPNSGFGEAAVTEDRWREKYYDKVGELNAAEAEVENLNGDLQLHRQKIESMHSSGDYQKLKIEIEKLDAHIQMQGEARASCQWEYNKLAEERDQLRAEVGRLDKQATDMRLACEAEGWPKLAADAVGRSVELKVMTENFRAKLEERTTRLIEMRNYLLRQGYFPDTDGAFNKWILATDKIGSEWLEEGK